MFRSLAGDDDKLPKDRRHDTPLLASELILNRSEAGLYAGLFPAWRQPRKNAMRRNIKITERSQFRTPDEAGSREENREIRREPRRFMLEMRT
jgi:hypothetical protein